MPGVFLLSAPSQDVLIDERCFENNIYPNRDSGKLMHTRLCYMLQEEAPKCMREFIKTSLEDQTLGDALNKERQVFEKLRIRGIINSHAYQTLFPDNSDVDINDLDLTLLVCVIRNAIAGREDINWDKRPKKRQQRPQHDVIRLKLVRNELYHTTFARFDEAKFERQWYTVSEALMRLGTSSAQISKYATMDMDPNATCKSMTHLKQEALDDLMMLNREEARSKKVNKFVVLGFVTLLSIILVGLGALCWKLSAAPVPCIKSAKQIGLDEGVIQLIPREGWRAAPPTEPLSPSKLPFKNVIISHSAWIGTCKSSADCCDNLRKTQHFNQFNTVSATMWDIAYNFLIGGDGIVYEGRGSQWQGAFAKGWNRESLGLSFIGEFSWSRPPDDVLRVAELFLKHLEKEEVLAPNYKLYGHCQLSERFPKSPGAALYREIKKFSHWREFNGTEYCAESIDPF